LRIVRLLESAETRGLQVGADAGGPSGACGSWLGAGRAGRAWTWWHPFEVQTGVALRAGGRCDSSCPEIGTGQDGFSESGVRHACPHHSASSRPRGPTRRGCGSSRRVICAASL